MEEAINTIQQTEKIINNSSILFFDMDGTLIDTDYANFLSYSKAIQDITKSEIAYKPNQRFTRSVLINSIPNLSETDIERIIQEKEKNYKIFLPETKLIKPIAEILFRYSKTNKTVLVTNCREERALMTLNYHGITDKFSNLFFRQFSEDIQKINKFQNAISVLGISPKSVVAFENEEVEIEDAIKAGINDYNLVKF